MIAIFSRFCSPEGVKGIKRFDEKTNIIMQEISFSYTSLTKCCEIEVFTMVSC